MATDATGTPTTNFSLPKFDVSNDAPSGLGFNAAMDAIDTQLAAMPQTPSGIVSGEAMVYNGTTWVRSSVTKLGLGSIAQGGATTGQALVWNGSSWAPGASGMTRGTSLPGSPSDGDTYLLVDSTTAPTYAWSMRYSTDVSGTYKWECIGGAPKVVTQSSNNSATTSSTYTSPTNNVTFTIPNAGDWIISIGYTGGNLGSNNSSGYFFFSYDVGATTASDEWAAGGVTRESTGDRPSAGQKTWLHSAVSASSAITGKYRRVAGDTSGSTVDSLVLTVLPVRVI